MFTEHTSKFHGAKVKDFEGPDSWSGPASAYRLRWEYDQEGEFGERLDELLAQKDADKLTVLLIGMWPEGFEGKDSRLVVEALVERAKSLVNLEALFVGDIVYEEQELSWINQSDMAPLLSAFPRLQVFQVRGSNSLKFSPTTHAALRELIVESGGLPRSVLREIFRCDFPNLEHLELHLGEENYGFDGDASDLQPLLAGNLFPKLRYLGLRNCQIADEVAAVVAQAPLVRRIETLDLSLGNLSNEGARALTHLPRDGALKVVNISHHYVSEDVLSELKGTLSCQLIAEDSAGEDEDGFRSIVHAE